MRRAMAAAVVAVVSAAIPVGHAAAGTDVGDEGLSPGCVEANDPKYDASYVFFDVVPIEGFAVGERLTLTTTDAITLIVGGDTFLLIEGGPFGTPSTLTYTFVGPPTDELLAGWVNSTFPEGPEPTPWEVTCEGPPTVSPFGVIVEPEGDPGERSTWRVPVFLSKPWDEEVTVAFETVDAPGRPGVAAGGSDYVATSGTVTFAPGEVVQYVDIEILGDADDEPPLFGGEWGIVQFSDVSPNAVLDTATFFGAGLFIIRDDD